MYIAVKLSVAVPANRIKKISIVDGTSYSEYTFVKKRKEKYKKLTISLIGKINTNRNVRKTMTTIITLSICGIGFIFINIICKSYDPIKFLMRNVYPYGNVEIHVSTIGKSTFDDIDTNETGRLQAMNNPLTENFKSELMTIEGVDEIYQAKGIEITVNADNGYGFSSIEPLIDESDFEKIKPYIIEGNNSYKDFVSQKGLLVDIGQSDIYKLNSICKVNLVDKTGKVKTCNMKVVGLFDREAVMDNCPMIPDLTAMLPQEYISNFTGIKNLNCMYQIKTDGKDSTQKTIFENIVRKNPNIEFSSAEDVAKSDKDYIKKINVVLSILILVIFIFAIINFVNMVISNINSRKREIGLYQSLGIKLVQIEKMINYENMRFSIYSFIISIVFGSLVSYLCTNFLDRLTHSFNYKIPLSSIVVLFIILFGTQYFVSKYVSRKINEESIIYRLGKQE
jgi:putative ABC transport system permease protein